MKVRIVLIKTFEVVEDNCPGAEFLNEGDIFIPKAHGWEYKVVIKVMYQPSQSEPYCIDVMVKKL